MKASLALAVTLVAAGLALIPASRAQCNAKPKKRIKDIPIPNLLLNYKRGWKLTAEINDASEKSTFYLEEYYNTKKKEGFLRFKEKAGGDINLYYISATKEIFLYSGIDCQVVDLASPPKQVQSLVLHWRSFRRNFTILGPSALFARAWMSQNKELYYQGRGDPIRGIKSRQWAACLPGDITPTRVWFADDYWDIGYGTFKSLPLRITSGSQTVDIMMMQPYQNDEDNVFGIPIGKGCKRLAPDLPGPPNFANMDLDFHAEIGYINPSTLGANYIMSHLEIVRDEKNSLFSVVREFWEAPQMSFGTPLSGMKEVYDYSNGHVFQLFDRRPGLKGALWCEIKTNHTMLPLIYLPDRNYLNILDTILPTYETLKKASYLGIQTVRGMPAHIYELVTGPMSVGGAHLSHAVLTYSFLAEDQVMDTDVNQKNLPVRVAMMAYITGKSQDFFYFFANIHDVSTTIRNMNEKINVEACYDEEDETKFTWLQLGFPVTKEQALIMENVGDVKTKFLAELQRVTKLSPLRVPDILVDFTGNMVYVTVLVLEHPAIKADYEEIQNMKIMEPEWSEGVITLEDCLKTCSSKNYEKCSAVSYCGSFCKTTTKPNARASGVLERSVECNTYVKTEDARKRNIVLTPDAIKAIQDAIRNSDFKFVVEDHESWRAVTTLIAETIEFSTGGLHDIFGELEPGKRHTHQQGGSENHPVGFTDSAVGERLKTTSELSQYVGALTTEDCADVCRDRADCIAFSSCLVNRECIITAETGPMAQESLEQSDCTIFTKSFKSRFVELPGICYSFGARKYVNVTMANECAAMCLNEKEFVCKAFDFCRRTRKGKAMCRLQETNILDLGDPSAVDQSNAEMCSHYSRKHISDYRKESSKRLKGAPHTVIKRVSEAECARQCWEASFNCDHFDHCAGTLDLGKGDCMLFDGTKGPFESVKSPICSTYTYNGNYGRLYRADSPAELHSNSKATGLSFFMVFLGIAIGASLLVAYGFYKARQAGRA